MELQELSGKLNGVREVITDIQKEINESGASVANLRDNIRARKLIREISEVQKEIDSHDMEEMAKARRNFDEKYKLVKAKEDNLRVEVSKWSLLVFHDGMLISCFLSQCFVYLLPLPSIFYTLLVWTYPRRARHPATAGREIRHRSQEEFQRHQ